MPAHQVLPLTEYIFGISYSASATRANKIYSMDQSELLNPWAGIGTLTYNWYYRSIIATMFNKTTDDAIWVSSL